MPNMPSDLPPAMAIELAGSSVQFATPRRLPRAERLRGRVAVLDIAFASESGGRRHAFEHTTLPFIEALGPRLCAWIDHHDSVHHARFAGDARFVLATKAEHGACPEMVTPERVARLGPADTIVCHTDFDGIASAAKWLRSGREPYAGCDDDARAIDTRAALPGPLGARCDRALRARPKDDALRAELLRHLYEGLADERRWRLIDDAAATLAPLEEEARRIAERYQALTAELCAVDAGDQPPPYDRTLLLLLGQERARMALVIEGDNATFAAAYGSGVDFLKAFGLSGGMPTLVSLHRSKLCDALPRLGVDAATAAALAKR